MPVVYYESIKQELQIKPIYECRCDERLKTKTEESTRLASTGLHWELEHLKIKTRLIDEMFPSEMGDYVFLMCRRAVYIEINTRFFSVYYESMKRNLKIKPIYECRCNGRLQTKRFTRLAHTGLVVELEHLKIKTRLINEKFPSVKGECEI